MIKLQWCDSAAVCLVASTASMILWRVESVQMDMSVPQKLLSIDPTQ